MRLFDLLVIVCTVLLCGAPVAPLAGSRPSRSRRQAKRAKLLSKKRGTAQTTRSDRRERRSLETDDIELRMDDAGSASPAPEQLRDYAGDLDDDQPVTHQAILQALRGAELPLSANRKSVLPPGTSAVRQSCLGLVGSRQPQRSTATLSAPRLTTLLTRYLEGPCGPGPDALRNFVYTSIQVNANYAAKEHVDFNNLGPSIMIALGNFTSGRLNYGGARHTVREAWLQFDGRQLHSVEPFENGERYSVVYFCNGAYAKSAPGELDAIAELGLRVAPLRDMLVSPSEARRGLDAASEDDRVLLVRGLAKGCRTTASRSDLSRFGGEVKRWVAACLGDGGVGNIRDINDNDETTLPVFELRMHSNGDSSRIRAANTCFVVAPSKRDADAAAEVFHAASDRRLVVETYKPPSREP